MPDDLRRSLALLGPLEGRLMRAVWSGRLRGEFVVRDAQTIVPRLAYTTVMTTLQRLSDKGLLIATQVSGERAHRYGAAGTPTEYLAALTRQRVRDLVSEFGETALAAFVAELDEIDPEQLARLRKLAE
jgi:predicted transcriptional regulator